MTVLIFIIILALLVLVHELGHFIVAKASGIRVDEFGLGFPPRMFGKKIGETIYSINWIPFGGFVKIFGENPDVESTTGPDASRSFVNKNRAIQAAVLVAGVAFNMIFAWLLISAGFMVGLPTSTSDASDPSKIQNVRLTVTAVLPESPAAKAGIKAGDTLASLAVGEDLAAIMQPETVQRFIEEHQNEEITLVHKRGTDVLTTKVMPAEGFIDGRKSIGIAMDEIGTLKLSLLPALGRGAETAFGLAKAITVGFVSFIAEIFQGQAKLSDLSGPVGIAGLVGDARALGFIYLLTFTAFISVNLAVLNLMPFPALDGGRLLFVAIETVIRRRIKPEIANAVNGIGFALLILLMVVVTFRDITKLF